MGLLPFQSQYVVSRAAQGMPLLLSLFSELGDF